MSTGAAIVVNAELTIPRRELTFRASRAGGPGGQHVNTSSTRVELSWNVLTSRVLSPVQRDRLRQKLGSRLDGTGSMRVVASAYRSQARNREAAEGRLGALVRHALAVPKSRRPTRPTRGSKEKRLEAKKLLSRKKRDRGTAYDDG